MNDSKKRDSGVRTQRSAGCWIAALLLVGVAAAGCGASRDSSRSAESGGEHETPDSHNVRQDAGTSWAPGDAYSGGGADAQGHRDVYSASPDVRGGGADAGSGPGDAGSPGHNTNVNFAGDQDFGYFRSLLDDGVVPQPDDISASGFFAEHHTPLPDPSCGERICVQAMLGVMGNLLDGTNCTLLQVGLNSPLAAEESERPPLTLAVVVDVSGSMDAGDKIGFVQRGLNILVDELRDGDRLALVTYDDEARVALELTEAGLRRSEIRAAIEALRADGGTNFYAGLELGYQTILDAYDSGRQNRVILLSDGQPSSGITDPNLIQEMSRAYNSEGIGLTTIGLGSGFNRALMQGLAQRSDGNFYFLEDSGAVEDVFERELSFFTVPVAFDLEMQVSVGEHYALGAAHGTSLWEPTEAGGRVEIPSVFLAHRVSHSDVTENGGRRGGGSALLLELMPTTTPASGGGEVGFARAATVELTFREPGTDALVHDSIDVLYPHAPWVLLGSGWFSEIGQAIIQKSFVMLNMFVGIQRSTELFHRDEAEAAVGLLDRLIAAVEDYNVEVEDVDIEDDVRILRQLLDLMVSRGAPPADPDERPDDPWPAD